ncbi:unnamed protein product [Aspergillus niger]|nr:hypothetical protein CBS147345_10771 [Aspergillus niger]SPB50623.1 unnamed protein product [Aspergillus niger]
MVAKNRKKEKKARTGTIQAAQGSGIPISCVDVATDAVPKPAAAEEPEAFLPAFSQDAGYLEPLPGNVVRSYEPSAAEESEVFVPASGEDARAADSEQMGREAKGQARTERQYVQDGELRRALLDISPAMGGHE